MTSPTTDVSISLLLPPPLPSLSPPSDRLSPLLSVAMSTCFFFFFLLLFFFKMTSFSSSWLNCDVDLTVAITRKLMSPELLSWKSTFKNLSWLRYKIEYVYVGGGVRENGELCSSVTLSLRSCFGYRRGWLDCDNGLEVASEVALLGNVPNKAIDAILMIYKAII